MTRFTELLTVSTTSCLYSAARPNVPSFLIDMGPLRMLEIGANSARAESDEESAPGASLLAVPRGYLTTLSRVYILSTLHHFDSKVVRRVNKGPLIPCERRLAKSLFPEFQEVTFGTRFGKQGLT